MNDHQLSAKAGTMQASFCFFLQIPICVANIDKGKRLGAEMRCTAAEGAKGTSPSRPPVAAMPCRVPMEKYNLVSFVFAAPQASSRPKQKKSQVCAPSVYTSEADARNKKRLRFRSRWWALLSGGVCWRKNSKVWQTLQSRSLCSSPSLP